MDSDKCDVRIIHIDKVKQAKSAALQEDQLLELSTFFKIFADQSRLQILMALGHQEMCVCDIAAFLEISESGVSHQLRYLRNMGFVKSRRDGTVLYYRLTDSHVIEIIDTGLTHLRESRIKL